MEPIKTSKKVKVIAVVVYPIYINEEIEVEEGQDLKNAILFRADYYLGDGYDVKPIIQESETHSELVD